MRQWSPLEEARRAAGPWAWGRAVWGVFAARQTPGRSGRVNPWHLRNGAGMLQSGLSCKMALSLLSLLGKMAEQRSIPWSILTGSSGRAALALGRSAGWGWQRQRGSAGCPQLPTAASPSPAQRRALGVARLWAGRSRAMPATLRPGRLLAVVVLVLQLAGSLGECRSPAPFLCFCGSALLTDQTRDNRVGEIQQENFLWLKSLLTSFSA